MSQATSSAPTFESVLADHDRDPQAAAAALRTLAHDGEVPATEHRRFAWLVNHVMGEKLSQWSAAADTLERVAPTTAEPACVVQWAVASLLAGRAVRALSLLPRIAALGECSPAVAQAAVLLAVLQYASPEVPVQERTQAFNGLLATVQAAPDRLGRLSTLVAGSLNNITSRLMDDQGADAADPAYRQALTDGAQACRGVWRAVGNWMNHERADYLVALCANRLANYQAAKDAAQSGLATIDAHGSEDVDRAFLLLELARAHRGLAEDGPAQAARADAMTLAQAFTPDLREWFDSRAAA